MEPASDAQLIAESLRVPESFGEIFDRHAQTIHRYLARRIRLDEADEMLGDVFLAAFESRQRFAMDRESALPWLYRIAAKVRRHYFRHESVRRPRYRNSCGARR